MDIFLKTNVQTIKQIYKLRNIKYKSSVKKEELVTNLWKNLQTIKIQRFFRKNQICPVSMTIVKYPCFSFKPKGQNMFIYYNLSDIINYLITTGDFRDPKTRQEYTINHIKTMNKLQKYYNIKYEVVPSKVKMFTPSPINILRSFNNKKYYKLKKNKEDDILIMERCLDDIISSMRTLLEHADRRLYAYSTLNNLLFISFKIYFRRLVQLSTNKHVENFITQTKNIINQTVDRNRSLVLQEKIEVDLLRDHIITFLYQIQFDEINE